LAFVVLVVGAVVTGRIGYVVTEGISMEPTYHTGDLAVIAPAGSYHTGEIVAYRDGLDANLVVLHRIVGGNGSTGFDMKGDNNQSIDPFHPTTSQVIGRAVLHIPKVGAVITSPVVRLLLLVAALALLASLAWKPRRKTALAAAGPSGNGAGPGKVFIGRAAVTTPAATASAHNSGAVGAPQSGVKEVRLLPGPVPGHHRRAPLAWKIFAGLDVLFAIALVLALTIWPKPAVPVSPHFTQTGDLSYGASAPVSATYPTGRIGTGDPVFLKLVKRVSIMFTYTTDAPPASVRGTARLSAVVSSSDGWHTSLRLARPTAVRAGRARLSGTLDLPALLAVENSVTLATGVYMGELTVTVSAEAKVSFDGTAPVAVSAQLPLTLSPLEMTMSSSRTVQTAHGPAVTATTDLTHAAVPPRPSSAPHEVRLGLVGGLLLLIALTILVLPESSRDQDAHGEGRGGQELPDDVAEEMVRQLEEAERKARDIVEQAKAAAERARAESEREMEEAKAAAERALAESELEVEAAKARRQSIDAQLASIGRAIGVLPPDFGGPQGLGQAPEPGGPPRLGEPPGLGEPQGLGEPPELAAVGGMGGLGDNGGQGDELPRAPLSAGPQGPDAVEGDGKPVLRLGETVAEQAKAPGE
jgi:signal peptidase I